MRIGLDATFLRDDVRYSGMGVYVHELAKGLLRERGPHEIILLGYGARPASAPEGLAWQGMAPLPIGRAGLWLSHQTVLPLTARRLGLDLVHLTGVNVRLSMPGIPLRLPCPLVVTVHDAIPTHYYGRLAPPLPWRLRAAYRLAQAGIRRAAAVVAVSETSRRDIIEAIGVPPARVHAVHNGLSFKTDLTIRARREILGRLGITSPYLLYAGSYEPRKNLLGAVAGYRLAAARRQLPPLVLLVERESGHRAAVMEQVERSGIPDRLRFVHSLTDDEQAALYLGADLFLFPSRYEGFGFPPLQALACSLPVIAARAGSLPEVLGDAAHFVDPARPSELAEGILRLIDEPEYAAALRARGPAQAARFRWDAAARATRAVYEHVVATDSAVATVPSRA